MADVLDFLPLFAEDAESIRARINADANSGIAQDDPRWVDTREGTFFWDVTQPLVLEFARIYDALAVEVPAAALVPFAWGEYLDWHAETFNLERKTAVAATGEVTFRGDPGTLVGTGQVVTTVPTGEDETEVEFITTASGTTSAQVAAPTGLGATPTTTGGTLATGTYYYQVTAVNSFGETTGSLEVSAAVTGPNGKVTLDWADMAGATGYRVYRGLAAGGEKGLIASPAASTHVDTNATPPGVAGPPEENLTAGVTLPVEAVEAGSVGNVAALAISELGTPNLGIDALSNAAPTAGGTDTETDVALRERILLEFEGHGAGNVNDYRRWALEEPGVGRVFVNPAWNGPNTVQVVVMTENGGPVAGSVIASLQERLDALPGLGDGEAPIGSQVTVQTPSVVLIDVNATVAFEAGFSLDGGGGTTGRREDIEDALTEYIDGLNVGDDVIYEHVKSQFFRVPGVYNISGVTVEGGTADVAVASNPPVKPQLGIVTLA